MSGQLITKRNFHLPFRRLFEIAGVNQGQKKISFWSIQSLILFKFDVMLAMFDVKRATEER